MSYPVKYPGSRGRGSHPRWWSLQRLADFLAIRQAGSVAQRDLVRAALLDRLGRLDPEIERLVRLGRLAASEEDRHLAEESVTVMPVTALANSSLGEQSGEQVSGGHNPAGGPAPGP